MNTHVTRALLILAALSAVVSPVEAKSTAVAVPFSAAPLSADAPYSADVARPASSTPMGDKEKKKGCFTNCDECVGDCFKDDDEDKLEECMRACIKESSRCCYAIGEVPVRNACGCK